MGRTEAACDDRMSLACDPQLLIADEPYDRAFDVMVQAQAACSPTCKRDRGLAMIFITHDLSVLSTIADRLAVMYVAPRRDRAG